MAVGITISAVLVLGLSLYNKIRKKY